MSDNANVISLGVILSYLLLYTAYNKTSKALDFSQLMDFLFFRRGLDWTLVETNKLISLAGLTLLLFSFLPFFKSSSTDMLWIGMNLLWVHSFYSIYKFYGYSWSRFVKEKEIKKLSVFIGTCGQLVLFFGFYGYLSYNILLLGSTLLGLMHFYSMEVDFKGVLQVRPFAYLPFPLGAAVIAYFVYTQFS